MQTEAAKAHILARMGRFDEALEATDRELELAERVGEPVPIAIAQHDRGLVAVAAGHFEEGEALLAAALDTGVPISRPLARLARAEALTRLGRLDEAEAEVRATALEPLKPSDYPDTLVARLTRMQGLIAAARGDLELAERRLREAAAGWRRRLENASVDGEAYVANLTDLGRPPVLGLVEPAHELERVERELETLKAVTT
jgi:tetratricopeptide (TPR) repeat protein